MAGKLTKAQRAGLNEPAAACDESLRYWPSSKGWTRTGLLSGTPEQRSAANMRSLVALGLAEGEKPNGGRQSQWRWRITEAGRSALSHHEET